MTATKGRRGEEGEEGKGRGGEGEEGGGRRRGGDELSVIMLPRILFDLIALFFYCYGGIFWQHS